VGAGGGRVASSGSWILGPKPIANTPDEREDAILHLVQQVPIGAGGIDLERHGLVAAGRPAELVLVAPRPHVVFLNVATIE
jgi:hypothetical protein